MENRRQPGRGRQQYESRNYPQRSSPHKKEPEQKDRLLGMLCFQIAICAMGLALLLTARFLGGDSFHMAREISAELCGVGQEEIQLPELPEIRLNLVWERAGQVFTQIKEALTEAIHKNIVPPENQEEPSGGAGTIGESGPELEQEHSLQTGTSLQAAPNWLLETVSAGQAAWEGGQGGWFPAPTDLNTFGMLEAPEKASFAPYLINAALWVPVPGQITSEFGYRYHPITYDPDFHSGIDIASPEGTAIHAALPGVVEEAGWSDSYGNYIKLRHSNHLVTTYNHCSKILAEKGEQLSRGDRIALVGSTGISTGPHLHFEILIDEKKVDPLPALLR